VASFGGAGEMSAKAIVRWSTATAEAAARAGIRRRPLTAPTRTATPAK
jgi:hypothetical protein